MHLNWMLVLISENVNATIFEIESRDVNFLEDKFPSRIEILKDPHYEQEDSKQDTLHE